MASANRAHSPTSEKSISEWPALSDACGSNGLPSAVSASNNNNVKNRNNRKHSKPRQNSSGYDSAKENQNMEQSTNGTGGGAKKKSSQKTTWTRVPIEPEPYRRRGNGRHFSNVNRGPRNEGRGTFRENSRGNFQGNGSRSGRRDRDTSQYQSHQSEEVSGSDELPAVPTVPYCPSVYNGNDGIFYNPCFYNFRQQHVLKEPTLHGRIRQQVEYYFSDTNLYTDGYLRSNMDKQGFVDVPLIANFKRLSKLSTDVTTIIEALKESSKLEVSDDGKVRPVINPLRWVLDDNPVECYLPFFRKAVILPSGENMIDFILNNQQSPKSFNTCNADGEAIIGISAYNTVDVNSDMTLNLNSVPFEPVYFNGDDSRESSDNLNAKPTNDISSRALSISDDVKAYSEMFSNMNINDDISDNANSLNSEASVLKMSGSNPLNLHHYSKVKASKHSSESENVNMNSNLMYHPGDINCNASMSETDLDNGHFETVTSGCCNVNVTNRKSSKDTSEQDLVTVNSDASINGVSKQNLVNPNCDSDVTSRHDTEKFNIEADKVIPVFAFVWDLCQTQQDKNTNDVPSCNKAGVKIC